MVLGWFLVAGCCLVAQSLCFHYACSLPATSPKTDVGLVSLPTRAAPPFVSPTASCSSFFSCFFSLLFTGSALSILYCWVGPDLLDVCNNVFILLLKVDGMMLFFFLVCACENYVSLH